MAISPPGSDQEGAMATTKIWDGGAWRDLQGPAGPTVVSSDPKNLCKIGTDGTLLVSQPDLDAIYTNVTGDTMTGTLNISGLNAVSTGIVVTSSGAPALAQVARYDATAAGAQFVLIKGRGTPAAPLATNTGDNVGNFVYQTRNSGGTLTSCAFQRTVTTAVPAATNIPCKIEMGASDGTSATIPVVLTIRPLAVDIVGNITSTGLAHNFAANSITGASVTDRPLTAITASREIALADRSCNLANTSTAAANVVLTIPTNATAAFPIGTTFSIFDLSATASTILTAAAGVTLNWNGTLTGGSPAVAGGVAASVQIPSPFSRVNLIKTATDTWAVFN
jgi:hypothetical protein